jgi:hypothetical protein
MVILGGMMQPTHQMKEPIKSLALCMPSNRAFEGLLVLESKGRQAGLSAMFHGADDGGDSLDPGETIGAFGERFFPEDKRSGEGTVIAVLIGMLGIFTGALALVLKKRDIL